MRLPIWNILFSLFFVLLVISGIHWLAGTGRFAALHPWNFFLIALATFRLVRLFSYDLITAFMRERLADAPPDSFGGTLHALITCPWCTGLWFGFLTVFFYFATPYAYPAILILAAAAVGSFLQILANLVGWQAEAKKRQVQGG